MSKILKTFTNFIKAMSDKGVRLKEDDNKTIVELIQADDEFVLQTAKTDSNLTSAAYTEFNETAPEIKSPNYTNQQHEQIENSVLTGLIAGISHVVLNDAIRRLPLVNAEKLSNAIPASRGMSMGALINNIMLSQAEAINKVLPASELANQPRQVA